MPPSSEPSGFCGAMHDRATDSNSRSMSGAHRVNECPQKLYLGFLISSMNVMSSPHGCGRFTIRRSSNTRVPPLGVELLREAFEHVHRRGVRDGAGLVLPVRLDRLDTDVEHERVQERDIVARPRGRRRARLELELPAEIRAEIRGRAVLQKRVQLLPQRRRSERVLRVRDDPRGLRDLREEVHLEVRRERVRQPHVPRERAQDEVTHLNAVRRDGVAQVEVVIAQKLREVVQEHEQQPQGPAVQQPDRLRELRLT
eukprot:30248-Pelagococcus_subviridis.AAC.2